MIKTTLEDDQLIWAFDAVLTQIKFCRRRFRYEPAVIAFAINSRQNAQDDEYPWIDIKPIMQQIFDEDGVIVVDSGNHRAEFGRQDVDTLPARWAGSPGTPVFPLIVAGSVNDQGILTFFSQGPSHVTAWAPGLQIQCAKRGGFRRADGTSFSTGMVMMFTPKAFVG